MARIASVVLSWISEWRRWRRWKAGQGSESSARTQPVDVLEERELVMGLDFGTAYTKVVVGDAVEAKQFAIAFTRTGAEPASYLPTCLYIDRAGKMGLSDMPSHSTSCLRDLKNRLVDSPDGSHVFAAASGNSVTALEVCTGYLALVIREAKRHFAALRADVYQGLRLVWQLNLGIPTAHDTADEELEATYRVLAMASWRVAMKSELVSVGNVRSTLAAVQHGSGEREDDGGLSAEDIEVIPEVVASAVGYSRSDVREDGLHLLIDVGALTVDMATFRLKAADEDLDSDAPDEDVDDKYAILESKLLYLGAESWRDEQVGKITGDSLTARRARALMGQFGIEDAVLRKLAHQGLNVEAAATVSISYRNQCCEWILRLLERTLRSRDPGAHYTLEPIRVVVVGGGSTLEPYRIAIRHARLSERVTNEWQPVELETPSSLVLEDGAAYARLAVAHGLGYRRDVIGRIHMKREIADISLVERDDDVRDRFVGPEQV